MNVVNNKNDRETKLSYSLFLKIIFIGQFLDSILSSHMFWLATVFQYNLK
jgi:hypothetical protein